MKRQVTKVFINLIKSKIMKTLKLIVIAIMILVVGCQKIEQNNTDNPKDPTEQKTDKNDKDNKPDDQQGVKPNPTLSFATGVVRLSPEDYAKIPKAKFPATGDENLPDEFMLDYPKDNIPSQQALGSCVAFSLCSALYVKLMHERMHIPYEDRSRYPSAAFIYNQSKYSDCETGTIVVKAINLLEDKGVCYEKDMPYDPSDCWRQPTKVQLEKAKRFRIKGFSRIDITPTAFARALTLGYPIIVTADVSGKSFQEAFFKGKIWNPMSVDRGESYHCVNIIGYDKNNKTFTIFNSWGDGANKGRVLMSEEAIRTHIVEAYILELFDTYSEDDADSQKDPLTVTPSSIDFGEIDDAKNLSDKPLIIKANKDITIKSLTVSDTKNFEVQSYESVLSAGTSKSLVVRAYPKEAGNLKANVVITYEVRGERKTLEVPLSVLSKKGEVPPVEKERIDLDKSELAFYNVVVGQQDRGIINLTLISGEDTNVSIQLSDEVNFQTLSKVYLYKNSRQTASIGVTYRPRSAGTHRAKLLLTSPNGFNKEVSLFGQAKQPEPKEPKIALSTNYLSFQTELGNTSKQDLILSNTGNATAQVYLHTEGDSFRIENQSYILTAGSQQRISIIYQPQSDGYHPGTLVVNYNNLTEYVNLQGYAERKRDDDNHNHDDPQPTYYTIKEIPAAQDATIECPDEGLPKTHSGKGKIALRDLKVTEVGAGNLQVTGRLVKEDTERFTQRGEIYVKYGKFCENNKEKIGSYNSGDSSVDLIFFVSKAKINNKIYILTKSLENKTNRLFTNIVIELVRN